MFLALADLTYSRDKHQVTISARDLCAIAQTSKSRIASDTAELASRGLITIRAGGKHQQTRYQVNWWSTICVSTLETPTAPGVATLETPTLPLVSPDRRHGVSTLETPPTENKGLPRFDPALKTLSHETLRLIDQVFSSKQENHDPELLKALQRWLHSFMAKLGTDETGRRFADTTYTPPPPPLDTVAKFAAVAPRGRLETLLNGLMIEEQHPYRYVWFVYVALERIHGILTTETKQARAALHEVKRGQLIESSDPTTGPQIRDEFKRDISRIASSKQIGGNRR